MVRQLQEKNTTDDLIIEGLRELVIDVKEQLDKTRDDNWSNIAKPAAANNGHQSKECELIKNSVEGSTQLIHHLISTKVNKTSDEGLINKCNKEDAQKVIRYAM